jgi:curved DNA-binding protein CbpA
MTGMTMTGTTMSGTAATAGHATPADGITWYEVLGVCAGASTQTLRRAYEERLRRLRADLLAGAPPAVAMAAARARESAELAWLVLGDPQSRLHYDQERLAPLPAPPHGRVIVPDLLGLFCRPCQTIAALAGLRLAEIRLTPDPMPVEGLVAGQFPAPGTTIRRRATLTVELWHPPRREKATPQGPVSGMLAGPMTKPAFPLHRYQDPVD